MQTEGISVMSSLACWTTILYYTIQMDTIQMEPNSVQTVPFGTVSMAEVSLFGPEIKQSTSAKLKSEGMPPFGPAPVLAHKLFLLYGEVLLCLDWSLPYLSNGSICFHLYTELRVETMKFKRLQYTVTSQQEHQNGFLV